MKWSTQSTCTSTTCGHTARSERHTNAELTPEELEKNNLPDVLRRCAAIGLRIVEADTSYYLGRETLLLLPTYDRAMPLWRKRLFRFLSRNSRAATDFFSIPPSRVVEIGTQIEL